MSHDISDRTFRDESLFPHLSQISPSHLATSSPVSFSHDPNRIIETPGHVSSEFAAITPIAQSFHPDVPDPASLSLDTNDNVSDCHVHLKDQSVTIRAPHPRSTPWISDSAFIPHPDPLNHNHQWIQNPTSPSALDFAGVNEARVVSSDYRPPHPLKGVSSHKGEKASLCEGRPLTLTELGFMPEPSARRLHGRVNLRGHSDLSE